MQGTANAVQETWIEVCALDDLILNSGVCALVEGTEVAIFMVDTKSEHSVFAISNWDPIGHANVLYRGIIGSVEDDIVVASPLYKQHYSLSSGQCYENAEVSVSTYEVRVIDGKVSILFD